MDEIRLATPEEVERIKDRADLGPGCMVASFGGKDLAVIRTVTEVDPVVFDVNTNDRRKQAFIWGIETLLRFQGVPFYYFNVRADDEKWQRIAESNKSERVSPAPEIRFKKAL